MNETNSPVFRDKNITDCLIQLADRAKELGEPSTAALLLCLAGYRSVGQDDMLAPVAYQYSKLMATAIDSQFPGIKKKLEDEGKM